MAKFRFKVMFNGHTDYSVNPPKVYEKGSIIETDREMDLIYENKFQRLPSKGKPTADPVLGPEEFLKQQQEQNNSVGLESSEERDDQASTTDELDGTEEFDDKGKKVKNEGDGTKESGPEEVTSKFPLAKKADLKVFFDGESHSVTDADDKKNVPLNKNKKLVTDKDVNQFIKSHK